MYAHTQISVNGIIKYVEPPDNIHLLTFLCPNKHFLSYVPPSPDTYIVNRILMSMSCILEKLACQTLQLPEMQEKNGF